MTFVNRIDYLDFYIRNNFNLTPLNGKKPFRGNWVSEKLSHSQLHSMFKEPKYNFGVLLGEASGGIVDVDLDNEVARRLAPDLLPSTAMRFGRASTPSSHYIFRCTMPDRPRQFAANQEMIVELRSTGSQTMFPGSTHPDTQEAIEFQECGQPSTLAWAELEARVTDVAIATLLVRHWKVGVRHALSLALAGLLVHHERDVGSVERLVGTICNYCNDEEKEDRSRCVLDTFAATVAGRSTSGVSALVGLIGDDGRQIGKWLGIKTAGSGTAGQYPLSTDNDRAEAFAENGRGFRYYSSNEKRWYQKEHNVLRPVSREAIFNAVVKTGASLLLQNKANISDAQKFHSVAGINNIITMSQSKLEVDSASFDTDGMLLGCQNGVLSLTEGNLINPGASLVTKAIGTSYRPNATCPEFERFLQSTFDGDEKVIGFLQESIGYSLSGSTSESPCRNG